jgi:hypothetical protein
MLGYHQQPEATAEAVVNQLTDILNRALDQHDFIQIPATSWIGKVPSHSARIRARPKQSDGQTHPAGQRAT